MELILDYYRNPIFSIILLFCVVIIISIWFMVFTAIKDNRVSKNIEKYISTFDENSDYLLSLSQEKIEDIINSYFKANMFFECKNLIIYNIKNHISKKYNYLYTLAYCNTKLGLINEAKDNLLELLQIVARDEKALRLLAYIYYKLNDLDKTKEVFKCLNELCNVENELIFLNKNKDINKDNTFNIKINNEEIANYSIEYVCKKCSCTHIFYTEFCSNCFNCACLEQNIRIKL
ncbi:tetratricopeptide repeat protein [Campylobacter canadensis]|uniref:Tetratricopeptide repeat protein n=1 Tax=Campylobacter canadensis TaxID=449520 RepID=A0ABS7WQ42_9BACT|nr:hypothetical protein [Campylobacter canadensis]MBZ7986496.1 hypothetical protein [Campylobacter canadensis]MBZ7994101.1 hypothetical protein [Campylobacter canadensis]MBZ7995896.1 hypothetical protein [Campylobacter canadensis]MBZ7997533.1 hypothetical protein [Campylobacter canadensis]MBZ7999432.1 hypothetical protein [Campylobacter canadensis]